MAVGAPAWAGVFQPKAPQIAVPRRRGLNLPDLFQALTPEERRQRSSEDIYRWIRDWSFNFIRVPLDYRFWIDTGCRQTKTMRKEDVLKIREAERVPRVQDRRITEDMKTV
jgi:hypothetical protein